MDAFRSALERMIAEHEEAAANKTPEQLAEERAERDRRRAEFDRKRQAEEEGRKEYLAGRQVAPGIFACYKQGRNRTGSDQSGTVFHAVPSGRHEWPYAWERALCGTEPQGLSGGWSMSYEDEARVTCERCARKLAKTEKAKNV